MLAALALPPQLLQLGLALLQTLPFALVLHLVLLQGSLQGAVQSQAACRSHRASQENLNDFFHILLHVHRMVFVFSPSRPTLLPPTSNELN